MKDTALLLIDIQNDYFPGGRMELSGAEEAGGRAGKLLAACRDKGMPVIHIQHLSVRPGATFFIPGTDGAAINSIVAPWSGEKVIQKNFPNSFRSTELSELLEEKNVKKLIICGMMTHMCVDATVRAAFDLGYECTVAGDACATRDLDHGGVAVPALHVHNAFLAALGGVYAKVLMAEEVTGFLRND